MKRLLDGLAAGAGLAVLSPVLLLVAAAIRLDSPGPVLFRQTRIGLGGREFQILKFRSMVTDAATRGPFNTQENDPRITRVGRLIRKTSLDELPQLWNVLVGDMSLVGPRPDVPAQRGLYTDDEWRERHLVRPGITGLAQATLRSSGTEDQRKALDLRYVREISLVLDAKILLMTVRQVLTRGGN
ncbi:lipopolysaccharide/colanic/teichoic acid biosynthesis glycosyltransferase [Fluviicoccus keumensis]|uniref:Lipopolysaccharide/colanic/teichoic acid biosynthesis glycosyltransferase n=1 Tax=Fluviicoccus keumensis TaxID=1435465 RepID=A0A4Q7Z9P9_9GAMM|nr:sugar transferase [Fluviicoccus keumensis]RZU47277.1 lipopolysaccharide/colanic/teichoic acid biosynthesis glycosyltransferase [Fluviicoccus keumensis]